MLKDVWTKRGARCVGAVFVGSLLSTTALAGDLVITGAQSTPVVTSNADGNGPGNVTIQSAGSLTVGGGAALTINSNNSVSNAGTIKNTAESNATGILVNTGAQDITGNITDSGTLSLPGPASDSTLVGTSVLNTGIQVSGSGTFHGSITRAAGSTLTIGGNSSTGISISSAMDGSIVNAGTMTVNGNGSSGIQTIAPITGGVTNSGTITLPGQSSIGIYTGGAVAGAVINQGTITTGSAASTDSTGAAVAPLPGGHALWIGNNAGGLLLEGNGITKANEANGIPTGLPADSSLMTTGGQEALYIGPGGSAGANNITIGALPGDPSGASVVIRGTVTSTAATPTYAVRAINILGGSIGGIDYQTTLTGGFLNSGGDIQATSLDAQASAIRIGELTHVPSFTNTGDILARASDSSEDPTTGTPGGGGGDAYGLMIDARGQLSSVTNSGNLTAESHGATQSAYGIIDYSGTLLTVTNSGAINATVKGAGVAQALNLSYATQAETVTNSGTLVGDILLGSGSDTFTSTGGAISGTIKTGAGDDHVSLTNTSITGNVDLGDGSNAFSMTGGTFTGGLVYGTGAASANLSGVTWYIASTATVQATSLHVGGASTIYFNVDSTTGLVGTIKAPAVSLDNDTIIKTSLTGPVNNQLTVDLIEAQALSMNRDLSSMQPTSTVMYKERLAFADNNPNVLQLQITRNTASDLQLSKNLGAVYEGAISALATDDELSTTLGGFTDKASLVQALNDMMPDPGDGARMASLNAEDFTQGAVRRRLEGIQRDQDDPFSRYRTSYWAQEFTTYGSQGSQNELPGFRLISEGVAAGVDGEFAHGVLGGFSVSETLSYIDETQTSDRNVHVNTTSLDFYTRANFDPIYVQAIVGAAYEGFSSTRTVAIEDISRSAAGDWSGNNLHASTDIGTTFTKGPFHLSIYGRGSVLRLYQHDYAESGGGDGIDLRYASQTNTSLRAGGGVQAGYEDDLGSLTRLDITAHGDYQHEFKAQAPIVTARFDAGDTLFSIQGATPGSEVISGGLGASLQRRFSSLSLDYDIQHWGNYLGHMLTLTYRHRF